MIRQGLTLHYPVIFGSVIRIKLFCYLIKNEILYGENCESKVSLCCDEEVFSTEIKNIKITHDISEETKQLISITLSVSFYSQELLRYAKKACTTMFDEDDNDQYVISHVLISELDFRVSGFSLRV